MNRKTLVSIMPTNGEMKSSSGIIYAMTVLIVVLATIVAVVSVLAPDADAQRVVVFIGTIVPVVFGFITVGGKVSTLIDHNKETAQKVSEIPKELNERIDQLEGTLTQSTQVLTRLPCQLDTGVPGVEMPGRHREEGQ